MEKRYFPSDFSSSLSFGGLSGMGITRRRGRMLWFAAKSAFLVAGDARQGRAGTGYGDP